MTSIIGKKRRLLINSLIMASALLASSASGQDQPKDRDGANKGPNRQDSPADRTETPLATDPSYRLSVGDEISVQVYSEADMSTNQRIDNKGVIRIPYAGEIVVANMTVREAEGLLEKIFFEKKLLRRPMVSISVRDFALRQVSVLGAVNSPGKFRLPREAANIEIVELITSLGGFRPTARSSEVKVTHTDESGNETVTTVDVEKMINGHNRNSKSFLVYPGDRLYVPERLF